VPLAAVAAEMKRNLGDAFPGNVVRETFAARFDFRLLFVRVIECFMYEPGGEKKEIEKKKTGFRDEARERVSSGALRHAAERERASVSTRDRGNGN